MIAESAEADAAQLEVQESLQRACDLCGRGLLEPVRLARCRCVLCACCVEETVRHCRQCPSPGVRHQCTGPSGPSGGGCLGARRPRAAARSFDPGGAVCGGASRPAEPVGRPPEASESLDPHCARVWQHRDEERRQVPSPKSLSWSLYRTLLRAAKGAAADRSPQSPVAKVHFNINPGYRKPTATVTKPNLKKGAVFESSTRWAGPFRAP